MHSSNSKPAVYLDIDGVILVSEDNLAIGADKFIKYLAENFKVYWLTTHCRQGDATWAVKYVNRASNEDLSKWLEKFIPTTWLTLKTEAIKLDEDFLWFDDDCYHGEKEVLLKRGKLNNWIEVNLREYPNQLLHDLKMLKEII